MKTSSPVSLITIALLIPSLSIWVVNARLGKKGDTCSKDLDCDQNNYIGCDRSTWTCSCPQTLPFRFFYTLDGRCLTYVDGPCTYDKTPELPSLNCVDNAICNKKFGDRTETQGKCLCKKGFYRTKGNQCAKDSGNSPGGSGGIETPRSTDGITKAASTSRISELHHSFSKARDVKGTFQILIFPLILVIFRNLL